MEYSILDVAYGALLHDIGKFYQRTMPVSNLTDNELTVARYNKNGGYYTHLHTGYTSRFMKNYLGMYNELERMISEHHISTDEHVHEIIQIADRIASAIDRQDEKSDSEEKNKRGNFIITRLHSVLNEVDFNKEKKELVFPLNTLYEMGLPQEDYQFQDKNKSSQEYDELFQQFIEELKNDEYLYKHKIVNKNAFDRMYNLLYKYLITVPASTYENSKPTVSLFDHLKLTSAIASCLYSDQCFEKTKFYMLELDISGIQKFIFQITQGSEAKKGLVKALRGRSILVGIITSAISYAYINAFNLTQSNILYNTGGGALILLPYTDNTKQKVKDVSKNIRKELFKLFQTDITFVDAIVELDKLELELFQSEKASELKEKLGKHKMQKFHDLVDGEFFYEHVDDNHVCKLCGRPSEHNVCDICKMVDDISDIYTHNKDFGIVYDFNHSFQDSTINNNSYDLGFVEFSFIDDKSLVSNSSVYVESINNFGIGTQKIVANSVPLNEKGNQLNFEQIINLTPKEYGDRKLAILKMDVDNLGFIFAYGLRNNREKEETRQRSISKYVTMSRLFEFFFGYQLVNLCEEVSKQINPNLQSANGTMFYINYAGGDDLVIIGSAYSIITLANEIHKNFSQFTGNKNITISGGIHIQDDKYPIRFGIMEAEKLLDKSKDNEKNAISLLDTRVPFEKFNDLLEDVNVLTKLISEGEVSRTMLYNIMTNISDKSYEEYVSLLPRIEYILYRNLGKKDKYKEQYQNLLKLIYKAIQAEDKEQGVQFLELKLKLAIMFTREEKLNGVR